VAWVAEIMKTILLIVILGTCYSCFGATSDPGLLFYLSGDHEFTADYAEGNSQPNYLRNVKIIEDGAKGRGFECAGTQLMSYWAPGNIYAQRGTLSFNWRSREPVGPTPFPIFRVAYADHSSWDMVWLRIDYNGKGGFDAFVTDINLARIRVSYVMPAFPKPTEWVHLALTWDETQGIRFYVNGSLVAQQKTQAVLFAGLDQFGPHSRTISPLQVQSAYNFIRGGDIDEIRIYDRMLADENVSSLARGIAPKKIPELTRNVNQRQWRDEWSRRYGWNRKGDTPPYLEARQTSVRKVEIHDVYDLKRWWWKGTDGIRETTWPGVFNRSRLPGRNDYFQLPDWDCYSLSGKSVTFNMPDEPWNHLEISGSAWGRMYLEGDTRRVLFQRPQGNDRTFHRLSAVVRGQKIRFENVEQEEPIGELSAYHVSPGAEPQGSARLSYWLHASGLVDVPADKSTGPIAKFIAGRYTYDERATMLAIPEKQGREGAANSERQVQNRSATRSLPIVHLLIPADGWQSISDGLNGIAIDLPPLQLTPASQALVPLNIQVKDPLWCERNLLDFSFSVKANEPRTLWLDTRDRILPSDKGLYLTIAAADGDFGSASLEGARVRLIFKPRAAVLKEHEIDRFTQARDNYAMMVEERPNDPRLNLYNRFAADITDLLRVNPGHWLAQAYWYDIDRRHSKPAFKQPLPPPGAPLWAFRQVEQLRNLKRFVLWYIDHRQIENGEFGGGLSDDGDLTNIWPGAALMGCEPEKIRESLLREMDAFYEQGMFTNGLSTIQADDLHSYEEGIATIGQTLLLDHGNPKQLERAMETARALNRITGINSAGHRHIRSSYFSGSKMAEDEPWGWARTSSYLLTQPALMLVDYNGSPAIKKLILELADGLLSHRTKDETGKYRLHSTVKFQTDQDEVSTADRVWPIFWAAWRWTRDEKYLKPLQDDGLRSLEMIGSNALDQLGVRQSWGSSLAASAKAGAGTDASQHLAWQITGDKRFLESLYAGQLENSALREYINTEGSLWIDRVGVAYGELQRARLGGVALVRNSYFPGHAVSWTFQAPANEESLAILIPNATPESLKIVAYNLKETPVKATITAWDLEPGRWEIVQGLDSNNDDNADGETVTRTIELERSGNVDFTFTGGAATVLTLKLVEKRSPYWARPDLGIGADDIEVRGKKMSVTIHSLGAVDTPPTTLVLQDSGGKVLSTVMVPSLKAPVDLLPKTLTVSLPLPTRSQIVGGSVMVDPEGSVKEITRVNNRVILK
jgi:hypothetical protein